MNTGINNDVLDKLIKINNLNFEQLEKNINGIIDSMQVLDDCYSGNSLNFISKDVLEQLVNFKKISNVVKNYSNVLENVKISYNKQDEIIADIMKNTNSQFK